MFLVCVPSILGTHKSCKLLAKTPSCGNIGSAVSPPVPCVLCVSASLPPFVGTRYWTRVDTLGTSGLATLLPTFSRKKSLGLGYSSCTQVRYWNDCSPLLCVWICRRCTGCSTGHGHCWRGSLTRYETLGCHQEAENQLIPRVSQKHFSFVLCISYKNRIYVFVTNNILSYRQPTNSRRPSFPGNEWIVCQTRRAWSVENTVVSTSIFRGLASSETQNQKNCDLVRDPAMSPLASLWCSLMIHTTNVRVNLTHLHFEPSPPIFQHVALFDGPLSSSSPSPYYCERFEDSAVFFNYCTWFISL